MCGIAGHIHLSKKASPNLVKSMLKKLVHRGPDGEGIDISNQVVIGMRRLSIIDLKGGMQPLYNEDKTISIVGNGEIYNAKELLPFISKHRPNTGSDIELIVHLYEEYGLSGLNFLRGMFAFCLVDKQKNQVIIARDRMGEKPLYVYQEGDSILLASELKALKSVISSDKLSIDNGAIDRFFHYYFIPEPDTIFKQIKKLPKATAMIIDLNTKNISTFEYWKPVTHYNDHIPQKSLRDAFARACKLNMQSDVPVAVSLSGGVDSSAVLCSLSNQKQQVTALSVGYEKSFGTDEREDAKSLATRLGTPFFEHEIESNSFANEFVSLTYASDDLIADIAAYSISNVYQFAHKKNFKVMIGGIGGDELFYGYEWVRKALTLVDSKQSNNSILDSFFPQANKLDFYNIHTPYKQAKFFLKKTYHSEFKKSFAADNSLSPMYYQGGDNLIEKAQFLNGLLRDFWLTSNCIALTDRLSMSHSVECRSPFLESDFVSTALSSTKNMLSFDKPGKYYFKKSLAGLVPEDVLNRPKKGFTPPVSMWLSSVISRYVHLINVGFLSEQKIISGKNLNLITNCWQIMPMYWYPIYQLLLLEIYGRMYYYDLKPNEIN